MKHHNDTSPRCRISVDIQKSTNINKDKCVTCKGRLLCNLPTCPILEQVHVAHDIELKQEFFGPAPSLFVGWRDYPHVFVGPISLSFSPDDASDYGNPASWYGLTFPDIIEYRCHLIWSMEKQHISSSSKLKDSLQEISLSADPPDVEIKLKARPQFTMTFSAISQPMGPIGMLEELRIASTSSVPRKVNSLLNDEVQADVALNELYRDGHDVHYLTRLLSSGLLGMEKKMVPTHWSITTVDNILSMHLIEKIKKYPYINEYIVLSNEYLGNRFEILLLPEAWEYEQLEAWVPDAVWTMGETHTRIIGEHETYSGRSDYAIREGGEYYAVRFAVCEILERIRRQAAVLVFRETSSDYYLAVGAWESRENVRHAEKKGVFSSLGEALANIESHLKIPLSQWKKKSIILNQVRLAKWVGN
jgi:hypothetical protein